MRSPTPQCPVNGEAAVTGRPEMRAVAVSCRAFHLPSVDPRRNDRGRVTLRESARYRP
jgi:hypothetical protein